MSTKISNLLFEENSIEIIHKTFENNILSEAALPEAKLKIVGKKIAQQISSALPDEKIMLEDPKTGVFSLKSLKSLCQKNLAGFSTNFISSRVSKTEDGVEGKQKAPSALDMKNFEKYHLYPLVIEDRRSGEDIKGGKSGETYFMLYFIPSIGEVIDDPASIKLHKYIFEIKDDVEIGKEGIIHFDLKELPHFSATFEMIQKVQKSFMSGSPVGFKDLFIKKTQLKSTGQGDETKVDSNEDAEADENNNADQIDASVHESALKGSLHKQDLSSLLFEKKSKLNKEEELISEEELLNEIELPAFTKKGKARKKAKKVEAETGEYVNTIFTNMFNAYGALPANTKDILRRLRTNDKEKFKELYNSVLSGIDKVKYKTSKSFLASIMSNKENDNIDDEKFTELSSNFTSLASVKISTDDETGDDDEMIYDPDDVKKNANNTNKALKDFFDEDGKVIESKRGDVSSAVKDAISKYKTSIPKQFKEMQSLFNDNISLEKIVDSMNDLISEQESSKVSLLTQIKESDRNAQAMIATLTTNAGEESDFIAHSTEKINSARDAIKEANNKLIKSLVQTINSGVNLKDEIKKISESTDKLFEVQGKKVNFSDPLVANVVITMVAGTVLDYSKYCYALFAACDEVSLRIKSSIDEDFYKEIAEMMAADAALFEANTADDDGSKKSEEEIAEAEKKRNEKMSEMAAIYRVQASLSNLGITPKEARELMSVKKDEVEQISSSVMEAISISPKNKLLNEATTTKASNPNIVVIAGKTLVNFDGSINRTSLKSMYDTLDKQNAFIRIKKQIKDDLLAVTGTKVFKDADEETLHDLLHSYFMSEFSNAGDMAASLSKFPAITRAKSLVTSKIKTGVAAAKTVARSTVSSLKDGFVWAASSFASLVALGFASILGYGGLKLIAGAISGVPILSALSPIITKMTLALAAIFGSAGSAIGISSLTLAGVGTSVYGLYNAVIGQYITAGVSGLAGIDPLANFMYQAIAYPLGALKLKIAAGFSATPTSAVFGWSKYWAAMTKGIGPIIKSLSATTTLKAGGGGLLASHKVFWSTWFSTGSLGTAAKTAATVGTKKAAAIATPTIAKLFLTKGVLGPLICGSIALYGAIRILRWFVSEDKEKDVEIEKVIGEMLKIYVLSTATNKNADIISGYLGLTNPSDRSLISQRIQPTQNEINLITEFFNTKVDAGFGSSHDSVKELFDMSSTSDIEKAKNRFQEAMNAFKKSFDIFEGSKKHNRETENASDWFKKNSAFNSYIASKTVDIRAFTIQKLHGLYKELQQDAQLLNSGAIELDKFKEFYKPGKILFIVKNFLEDGNDPNGQTFTRSNLSEIVTNKNDVVRLIEAYREHQLSNMSDLFNGTPQIDDDPLLRILSSIKDSDDVDKLNLQINISNIIKNINKHVPEDRVNATKILSILKSKAGGVTAGAIEKYFLEGNKIAQFGKSIFGQAEEQKYAKEWNEEISKVLAKSMEYCVDDLDVFKESKQHPIFLLKPVSREDFLSEGIIAEGPVLSALGKGSAIAGMGAAASAYLYGAVTGTSTATGLANAAIAWVGPATGLALGLKVAAIILPILAVGTVVYVGWGQIKKMAEVFIDKIKSKVSFNPWEDDLFVKELMPMVKKAAQGLVAYKYMEIIFALKDKLEKIGVKVDGFNNPMFKELNKKLANKKQISRVKNNLTKEGKELQGQFIDNMYKAKNALPREGLGKYLNQSTVDRFLDEILFGTNSPLAEVFKHSAMSDNDSSESFVYQKGLGLLLEDSSAQPKEVIISMNKLYSELADRVESFFKTDLNYNERITVEIQKDIDHLMQRSGVDILRLPKRLSQKLGDLHIPLLKKGGKNANQYLVDAISNGTGLSNASLSKVISSQGIKLRESRLNQGDLLLEALHTHDLKLLVESDVVNQIWQKGSNIDIVGVSDSKRAATRWFSTDGGSTWAIDDITNVASYTPPPGATDVTNTYNLSKLKTTYTSGPSASGTGPASMNPSGGMIAADGKAMGGFTPVLAPTAAPTWITHGHSILTQSVVNNILQTCADIFQTAWMVDGVARMTNVMFGDTLTLSDTMNKLNDINWSLLPSKMFLATTLITLDSLKEELKKRGIVIQGEVPTDILSNFDAASSRNLGGAVKQKADIVSQAVLNTMGVKDKNKSKVNEKQLKRAVEQSLTDGILVYYKNFNRDKYDERMKRAELGADVKKRRSAVDSKKFWATGLAVSLIGLGTLVGGPIGAWAGSSLAGIAGTAGTALGVTGLVAGSKMYNDAESGVEQLYASDNEFDSAVTKAERSMAAKEAAALADLLISFSKEVKGISSESIRLNNPNLLNTQYVHNSFNFKKLINESRLNEITGNTNTVSIDDLLSKLRASGIMVFNGDVRRGTPEYKEALSHTVETVESMLKSFFDIQVTGAEKYKSSNFVQNVVKSAVDPNTKPGQPASPMVAQANNGTSPPSMNSNGNMNDMMQLANMSGGNNMMMFMMMMMMQMSGRSSGGMDIMQLMQQLNGGKLTIGDAAQKISEEEGMEGFADAIELAISEANGSKPAMSGARVKQLYQAMNKNPLSKLSSFTLNSKFAKGSKINSKVFVEELKRYINIKEKAAKAIDSVATVENIVVFLSNVFLLDPNLRNTKGKYNSADFGLDSIEQASTKDGSKISILGIYYLHLINSSDKKVLPFKIDDTTITFNDDAQWQQYFGARPSSGLEIEEVPEDFVKMLRSVNKFLSEEIQTESIRAKKQDVEILEERYYKKKLSSLLFEEKSVKSKVKSKNKINENEINLRQEWLNIWDI